MPLLNDPLPDKEETIWDYAVEHGLAYVASEVFDIDGNSSKEIVIINPTGSGKIMYIRLLTSKGSVTGTVQISIGKYGTEININSEGTEIHSINKKGGCPNSSPIHIEYGGTYTNNVTKHTKGLITGGKGNFATGGSTTEGLAGSLMEGYAIHITLSNVTTSDGKFDFRIEYWIQ